MQCVNNLKQITLAAHNFESSNGAFPPPYGKLPTQAVPLFPRPTPQAVLLQYLENSNLYSAFNFDFNVNGVFNSLIAVPPVGNANLTAGTQLISAFICPSDPVTTKMVGAIGYDNYFGSTGGTACAESGTSSPGTQETNTALLGVFNAKIDYGQPQKLEDNITYNPGYLPITNKVTIASISDGTSNTAMFSEITRSKAVNNTADEVPITSPLAVMTWPAASQASFNTVNADPTCQTQTTWLRYRGQQYYRALPTTAFYSHTLPPNSPLKDCLNLGVSAPNGISFGLQTCAHTAARSYHSGGVNTSFCDGSVRFIKNSVNSWNPAVQGASGSGDNWTYAPTTPGGVFQALGTRAGGEIVSADQY